MAMCLAGLIAIGLLVLLSSVPAFSQGALGAVSGTVTDTREFLHDVRVEMKQVTWPSKDDVISTTWVVIATVAFFGFFLWLVDLGVQRGVQVIFKKFGV